MSDTDRETPFTELHLMRTELATLRAKDEIRELSARYSHGNDKSDPDLFMSIWADDARWQPDPRAGWHEGLEAIRARQQQNWDSGSEALHVTTNHLIDVTADHATGVVDVLVLTSDGLGSWARITATYTDEYVHRGGRWAIASRTTTLHSWEPLA